MIVIGIFLQPSIIFAKIIQEPDLVYKIIFVDETHSNCLDIAVDIKGNSDGNINIKFPKYVRNFIFKAKQGTLSYSFSDNLICNVKLEPNVDMEVKYQVCATNPYRDNQQPIIESGFFHFMSEALLILPDNPLEEMKKVKFQFINFPPNYLIATNYNFNKHDYEIQASIRDLSRSIITGGLFDVKTIPIKDKPVYMLIKGQWEMFSHNQISEDLQKLIQQQRDFTADDDFPHFLVILFDNKIPFGKGGVSGSLYENVLSMVITDAKPENKPVLLGILSHELFHAWMGNKIRIPSPQGNLQWFFEGVNDFYGWQLALESKMISETDYVNYYNKILKEYTISPFKEASNEEIATFFNLRNPAGRLAMIRGHIVFMEILNKLKAQGKTREPLDLALKEILQNHSYPKMITDADINRIFSKHLGHANWAEAAEVIRMGNRILLSSTIFSKKIKLKEQKMDTPDFGFDVKSLVKEKQIKLLKNKSNAALAGLKNKTIVLDYGIDIADPEGEVQMIVDNQQQFVSFTPKRVKKLIPQYGET